MGGSSLGGKPQNTEIEEKRYEIMHKQYDKGRGKFVMQNPLGEPIKQDVKNRDENSEEKENDDNKNSILYNILVN